MGSKSETDGHDSLVVDTNVFVHASNPDNRHFGDGVVFFERLLRSDIHLLVDCGFSLDDKNTSLIGNEYRQNVENLPQGSAGRAALFQLLISNRIIEISCRRAAAVHRMVCTLIKNGKPRDRTFLKVAFLSKRKTLVSHDFEDFSHQKRSLIKKKPLTVIICTAGEASL